jgi:hypothetical protein
LLLANVSEALRTPPVNVLRVSLHPQGLGSMLGHYRAWRAHVLARLQRQQAATGDATLAALWAELRALPVPDGVVDGAADDAADGAPDGAEDADDLPLGQPDIAVPVTLHTAAGRLDFITTVTVFGAPHDVTLSELAVETLLPANEATARALRDLHAALP